LDTFKQLRTDKNFLPSLPQPAKVPMTLEKEIIEDIIYCTNDKDQVDRDFLQYSQDLDDLGDICAARPAAFNRKIRLMFADSPLNRYLTHVSYTGMISRFVPPREHS